MTFTKFSNDTKADRNFSQKSKKGLVPKNRLRQNIKKKSERARVKARMQRTGDNYQFFGPETMVVHRHRNDFRKHPSNYNLEFIGEMEEIDLKFEFKYDYTWWYELMDEEPDYCSHEPRFRGYSAQPVTYYQDDSDSDSDDDYQCSRFSRNDGWDIDEYQPVGLSTRKHSSSSEDEFQTTTIEVRFPSEINIRNLNNEKLQIEIQKCDDLNQMEYDKIRTKICSDEMRITKRRRLNENGDYQTSCGLRIDPRELDRAAYLDRLEYNYGLPFNMTVEEEEYYFG